MNDKQEVNNIINVYNYTVDLEEKIENRGLVADFLSINNKDNKKYICKLIPIEKKKKEIENSIYLHSTIKHEKIVKLYDNYKDAEYYFLFLEYIEGKTLAKTIQNTSYDENEIFIIIEQIIDALSYLYEKEIVLKNLLLRNIFVKNKCNENEKTKVLLCNLDNRNLLSNLDKYPLEEYYNKIVFKLGIIICELLDNEFSSFLSKNKIDKDEENQEIIGEYIRTHIINKKGITENIINLIITMVLLVKDQRIHITEIKKHRWYRHFYKTNKKKKEIKENQENKEAKERKENKEIKSSKNNLEKNESVISESINSSVSLKQVSKKNKNLNIVKETITTDEGYLEYYEKEKELLLGLIDNYDKDELNKMINLSKKYSESIQFNNDSKYCQNESTEITTDKSEKSLSRIERKK